MSADDPKAAPVCKTFELQKGDLVLDPSGHVTEVRNAKVFTKQPIKVYRKNDEDDYVAIWWSADE